MHPTAMAAMNQQQRFARGVSKLPPADLMSVHVNRVQHRTLLVLLNPSLRIGIVPLRHVVGLCSLAIVLAHRTG